MFRLVTQAVPKTFLPEDVCEVPSDKVETVCAKEENDGDDCEYLGEDRGSSEPKEYSMDVVPNNPSSSTISSATQATTCRFCNTVFHNIASFQLHRCFGTSPRLHQSSRSRVQSRKRLSSSSGPLPFVCSICNKSFATSGSLRTHERFHSDFRPYSCKVCTKSFIQISDLRRHERIHSGDRPYSCGVCNKAFSDSSNLRTHERIHTGYRPYVCKVCHRGFMRLSQLKAHQHIHDSWPHNVVAGGAQFWSWWCENVETVFTNSFFFITFACSANFALSVFFLFYTSWRWTCRC